MILYTTTNYYGEDCVVQFQYGSTNTKTGDGVQIWILPKEWVIRGKDAMNNDSASCMDCVHSKLKNRSCYVRKGFAEYGLKAKVQSLHKLYLTGDIDFVSTDMIPLIESPKVAGKFVRFGAYGEPVLLGEKAVSSIVSNAANFTGYTHQWRVPQYSWAKDYFMASVETEGLMSAAHALGFRTFRVRSKSMIPTANEVVCPASKEAGRKTTCNNCALCKGASSKAKSVTIIKH